MVKISVSLSIKDINDLKDKINMFKDELNKHDDINKAIANECADMMLEKHDARAFNVNDPYNHSAMTNVKVLSNKAIATIQGSQVVYDEFGTGDVGANSPHPDKARYSLNGYASGPYVSTHIDNVGHYWDFDGYSRLRGVPARLFVYDSVIDMKNGKANDIGKSIVKNKIKKVFK